VKKYLVLLLVISMLFFLTGDSVMAEEEPIEVRIATEVAIDLAQPLHPSGAAILTLQDFLEGTGRFEVSLYPAMELGDTHDLYSQIKREDIHITTDADTGTAGSIEYEPLMIFGAPFVFPNQAVAARIMNTITRSEFMREMSDDMAEKTGVRPLHVMHVAPRVMSSALSPIESPEDLEGQVMRVLPAPFLEYQYELLGADPVTISWAEIYSALETGVADGLENAYLNYLDMSLQEVQNYWAETNHSFLSTTSLVNEEWFQGLSVEDRRLLLQGFEVYHDTYIGTAPAGNQYSKELILDVGGEITEMTPEDREAFAEIVAEPMNEWWIDFLGEEANWYNELLELVDEVYEETYGF